MYKIDRRGRGVQKSYTRKLPKRRFSDKPSRWDSSPAHAAPAATATVTSAPVKLVTNVIFRVIFSLSVLTNQVTLTLYFNLDKF